MWKSSTKNGKPFHINSVLYADKLLSTRHEKGLVAAYYRFLSMIYAPATEIKNIIEMQINFCYF